MYEEAEVEGNTTSEAIDSKDTSSCTKYTDGVAQTGEPGGLLGGEACSLEKSIGIDGNGENAGPCLDVSMAESDFDARGTYIPSSA